VWLPWVCPGHADARAGVLASKRASGFGPGSAVLIVLEMPWLHADHAFVISKGVVLKRVIGASPG
jgi:hypothetical protein